jgi:hypothetical protein
MDAKRPRQRRRIGWVVAGFAGVTVVAGFWMLRGRMAPVTIERLDAAERRWREAAIADYDMRVVIEGASGDQYDVVVRDGALDSIRRGRVAVDPADGGYWTVEGLFRTIRREWQMAEDHEGASSRGGRSVVFARFDPARGYPTSFLRQVTGTGQGVLVVVERFRPR